MSAWAKPGVKCICIADEARIARGKVRCPWANFPSANAIYTVRGTVTGADGVANLLFEEISNPPHDSTVGVVEWGFPAKYFRPLVSQKDDIATHFAQYLKTNHRATRRTGVDA